MLISYHVDDGFEYEERTDNAKQVLDCLRSSTRIYVVKKYCKLIDIDYNVEAGNIDVWLTAISE
jgi:hypothetical protein